jgi:hypothetical protein
MTNHILDDYVDALKPHLRQLSLAEQRQVLRQVRDHLEEDIRSRREADPKLSADEAAIQATAAFGDPQDIGVAYGSGGGVVRKSTGEVLLHVAVLGGRGVARTVGKTVRWTGIALGFLILVGAVVFVVLAVAYQPTVERGLEEVASYRERDLVRRSGGADGDTAVFTDTFSIGERTVSSSFHLVVTPTGGAASGCMTVLITGPQATRVYDSTGDCGPQNFQGSFTAPGTYTIEYRQVAFTGTYSIVGTATDRIN